MTPEVLLRRLGVSPTPQLFTRSEQIWQSLLIAPPPLGPMPAELRNISDLQEHWLERLAFGPTPLHDRIAQTFAGLFAVDRNKVPDPGQLWQHLETIRQQLRGGIWPATGGYAGRPGHPTQSGRPSQPQEKSE